MIAAITTRRIPLLVIALLLASTAAYPQVRKRSHSSHKHSRSHESLPTADTVPATNASEEHQIELRLIDGTLLPVDDASETPQGIWYKIHGVSYLIGRDRVRTIEHGAGVPTTVAPQATTMPAPETTTARAAVPVWIYLVGGARLEVDSADEASAGVWYRRGSLAAFIERGRIDHLEREEIKPAAAGSKELGWSTGSAKIDGLIRQNGARHGVDPYLIFCVMEQESHFNSHSTSPKGARGLMQLMPGTSARFGVRHPYSPAENISAGTRYLKQLIERFNGRIDLVLASYNAGEGSVIRFGSRVPPYRETRNYVKRVSYRYRRTNEPVVSASSRCASPAAPAKTFD